MCFHLQKGVNEINKSNLGEFESLGWDHTDDIIQEILKNNLIIELKRNLNESYLEIILKKL